MEREGDRLIERAPAEHRKGERSGKQRCLWVEEHTQGVADLGF